MQGSGILFKTKPIMPEGSDRFTTVYNSEHPKVFRYVYMRLYDYATTSDITQQAFLKLFQVFEKVISGSEGGYVMTIAKNLLIDHYRTKKQVESFDETLPSCSPLDYQEHNSVKQEDISFVRSMLSKLSESYCEIIELKALAGYEYSEIAQHLQLSEGSVRKRYSRALSNFRDLIKQQHYEHN
jgi:RNA polymerase sigma-70 factor (ECF subfamily)